MHTLGEFVNNKQKDSIKYLIGRNYFMVANVSRRDLLPSPEFI
jgi:hypothetical protein